MSFVEMPVLVAAALAAYAFAHRRLNIAAQPLRLDMARKGEALLAQQDLPDPIRKHVELLLGTAFGMRAILIASLFVIPFYAALIVVRQRFFRESLRREFRFASKEQETAFDELFSLHERVCLANHPLLLVLVEIQILACVPLAILIRGVLKGSLATIVTRRSMLEVVEERVTPRLAAAHIGWGMPSNC